VRFRAPIGWLPQRSGVNRASRPCAVGSWIRVTPEITDDQAETAGSGHTAAGFERAALEANHRTLADPSPWRGRSPHPRKLADQEDRRPARRAERHSRPLEALGVAVGDQGATRASRPMHTAAREVNVGDHGTHAGACRMHAAARNTHAGNSRPPGRQSARSSVDTPTGVAQLTCPRDRRGLPLAVSALPGTLDLRGPGKCESHGGTLYKHELTVVVGLRTLTCHWLRRWWTASDDVVDTGGALDGRRGTVALLVRQSPAAPALVRGVHHLQVIVGEPDRLRELRDVDDQRRQRVRWWAAEIAAPLDDRHELRA
jgi:hypothetical protein